jgi:DNA-binding response OmpR family regulator
MEKSERRILVVDDDDAIRALLFTVLRRRGFAVDQARNGEEALARLDRCRYSVMLLDLMMPRLSGWDVLEALAKRDAATRPIVLVLTAGTEPRDLDAGVVSGSMRKPFDVELLLDTIVALTNAIAGQPQLPDCPPADSERAQPAGNRKVN